MKKLYLLLGQEHLDKVSFIKELKSGVLRGSFTEEEKISGDESKGENLLYFLQNQPLFGGNRLFIVELAEKINPKLITPLINAYNQREDILILQSEENKLPAWESAKGILVQKKIFYPLSEMDKKSYALKLARDFKRKLTPEGAEYFVQMAGTDKSAMDNLSGLIFPSLPEEQVIDETILADYLSHSRTETVYTLFYAILEGDLGLALARLSSLIQARTEVVPLMANLLWQLRRFLTLVDEGGSYETFQRLRIFRNEKLFYDKALRLYSPSQVEAMINRTIHYDLITREEKSEKQNHLLQTYLYELIVKKGQALDSFKEELPLLP